MEQTLQKHFGYSTFRPLQREIIQDILDKKDVFVLMPTGGGKSLCYQLPSVMMNGITIVISPLISLMKDQVDALQQNGVRAAYLNSSLSSDEQQDVIQQMKDKKLSLVYIAPERLVQPSFLTLLNQVAVNFFAIDEAHCISQWGHDFRPEYRQLDLLRKYFPDKSVIALTATATSRVKQDIIEKLQLNQAHIYQASFNRPNLHYYVTPKRQAFAQTLTYIQRHTKEAGIVYCQSRKTVEFVAAALQKEGIRALPYHAGLADELRKQNQDTFIHEDVDVIVATVAFGMGIDKPNVRYVIHYDLPKSLEHYYQETGRAGRDGLPSECILFFSYGDKFSQERFIREKENEIERQIAYSQLERMIEYSQSRLCRRILLLQYFAEEYEQTNCASCDNCQITRETFDASIVTQKILSCVYRLGGRFGLTYTINVLTGSKAGKIISNHHDQLSTYGIVTDYSRQDLRMIMYELVQLGYLKQSDDQYATVSLTNKSKAVLQGKEKVILTKPEERIIENKETENIHIDQELFNTLRLLRKQLADQSHVPPYIIFSDKSLQEMATYFPQSLDQFSYMYGVGQEKLKKYGEIFIKEIAKYCEQKNIQSVRKVNHHSSRKTKRPH